MTISLVSFPSKAVQKLKVCLSFMTPHTQMATRHNFILARKLQRKFFVGNNCEIEGRRPKKKRLLNSKLRKKCCHSPWGMTAVTRSKNRDNLGHWSIATCLTFMEIWSINKSKGNVVELQSFTRNSVTKTTSAANWKQLRKWGANPALHCRRESCWNSWGENEKESDLTWEAPKHKAILKLLWFPHYRSALRQPKDDTFTLLFFSS